MTGDLLRSFMKHPSSVRTFDFNYDVPSQIFCGRTDGHITVWNMDHLLRMDDVTPEPEWCVRVVEFNYHRQENATEESLLGWQDVTKRHSGMWLITLKSRWNPMCKSCTQWMDHGKWIIRSYLQSLEYHLIQKRDWTSASRYFCKLIETVDQDDRMERNHFESSILESIFCHLNTIIRHTI